MEKTLLQKLADAVKSLPTSDKWLLGVAIVILINPSLTLLIAVLIVAYFIWKIGKAVI